MQREQSQEENCDVHLLPAFALPPTGVEDEKRQREKGKRLTPITTNIWKKMIEWGKPGQAQGFRDPRLRPSSEHHQLDRANGGPLPHPVH